MSWPAMSLYFPSRRKPVIRATIRRGLCFRRASVGERPRRSRTPGRKGSIKMSAVVRRRRRIFREVWERKSRVMEVLLRVSWSPLMELGRSMRRTEAPKSARRRPANGPGSGC